MLLYALAYNKDYEYSDGNGYGKRRFDDSI